MNTMDMKEIEEIESILLHLSTYKTRHLKGNADRLSELLTPVIEVWKERYINQKGLSQKDLKTMRYLDYGHRPVSLVGTLTQNLSSVSVNVNKAFEDIGRFDREIGDLLHLLELTNPSDEEMLSISKTIQGTRQKRRVAKDYREMMLPLEKLVKRHSGFVNELGKLNSDILQMEQAYERRTYTPRELTDIEEAFRKAKEEGK